MKKTILVLLLFLVALPSYATTYYVRKDGNDACNGTVDGAGSSGNCAKLTVQAGVNLAYAGDTVQVAVGDYSSVEPTFSTARAGSAGSPITIKAKSGDTVTISRMRLVHAYTIGDGFSINKPYSNYDPGVWIGAGNVTVQNNTIYGTGTMNRNSQSYGVANGNWANYITITNNTFTGSKTLDTSFMIGIYLGGSYNDISYNTFSNLDSPERAIEVYGSDTRIHHNLFKDWIATSLDAHPDIYQILNVATSYNILVDNNIALNLDAQIANLECRGTSGQMRAWTFRNNIFANVTGALFADSNGGASPIALTVENNLFYNTVTVNQNHPILAAQYGTVATVRNNAFVGCGYQDAQTKGWSDGGGGTNNFVSTISGGSKSGFSGTGAVNGGTLGFIATSSDCINNTCNFQLASDSSLINAGVTISGFASDLLGAARPYGAAWDIGPYEYGGSVTDTTAPVLSNLSPTGVLACTSNPRDVTLAADTDEASTLKMSLSHEDYAVMTDDFTTTGGTSHSEVKSLPCGVDYYYYVKARDTIGNVSYPSIISFSIEPYGKYGYKTIAPVGMRVIVTPGGVAAR